MKLYILSLLAICISVGALAVGMSHRSEASDEGTRIVIDQESGVIRFLVNGEEQARIAPGGVQVRNSIAYGGTLTDVGTTPFDQRVISSEGGANAP